MSLGAFCFQVSFGFALGYFQLENFSLFLFLKLKEDFPKPNFPAAGLRMQKVFILYTSSTDKRPALVFYWRWITKGAWDSSCFSFFFFPPLFFFPSWIFDTPPPQTQVGVGIGTELRQDFSLDSLVWSWGSAGAVERPAGKMMEEISIMVAYDAHVFSQLHDEDFLTSLVAVSKPRSMVGGVSALLWGWVFFPFLTW